MKTEQLVIKTKEDLMNFFESATYEDIVKSFLNLFSQTKKYNDFYIPEFKVLGLFRARVHNRIDGHLNGVDFEKFEYQNQHWEAPKTCIKDFGRCNCINQPLLYCSNNLITTLIECRPKDGEFITVAHYESISEGEFLKLNVGIAGKKVLSQMPKLRKTFNKYREIRSKDDSFAFLDFLDDIFLSEHPENYKISAAVANCLMSKIYEVRNLPLRQGLLYPSIAHDYESINIVLNPDYAKSLMKIVKLTTFRVELDQSAKIAHFQIVKSGIRYPTNININHDKICWLDISNGQIIQIKKFK